MAIHDDRRATAGTRRERIIDAFSRELDPHNTSSSVRRLEALFSAEPRDLIVSGDIDGLVSAAMLAKVAPEWRAVALIIKSDTVLLHPDIVDGAVDLGSLFGVDVFSSYFPSVSNHVVLWGGKAVGGSKAAMAAAHAHDAEILRRADDVLLANPSLWARIEGSYTDAGARPFAAGYRYPLGTAQILLAMLEAIDRSPRMFDREYLPWLIANCDGGLKTVREYAYNVPMWWSAMAAAVGPASLTEHMYQLAMNQRSTEFVDAVNRLRSESTDDELSPARHLDDDWNMRSTSPQSITAIVKWISSISGWPDPLRGGTSQLDSWYAVKLTEKGYLLTTGMPVATPHSSAEEEFRRHLRGSLDAVHTNFAYFDGKQRLNWVAPWPGAIRPDSLALPTALQPGGLSPGLDAEVDLLEAADISWH